MWCSSITVQNISVCHTAALADMCLYATMSPHTLQILTRVFYVKKVSNNFTISSSLRRLLQIDRMSETPEPFLRLKSGYIFVHCCAVFLNECLLQQPKILGW